EAVSGNGPQDFRSGLEDSRNCSANLALADSTSIRNGNLDTNKPGTRCLDLHFDRPTKVRIAHREFTKFGVSDCSKRTEVSEPRAEQPSHQKTREMISE